MDLQRRNSKLGIHRNDKSGLNPRGPIKSDLGTAIKAADDTSSLWEGDGTIISLCTSIMEKHFRLYDTLFDLICLPVQFNCTIKIQGRTKCQL